MKGKWIDKDLFAKYVETKEQEAEPKGQGMRRSDFVWPTPAAGTADKPKVYEGRLLQDPKGLFTKKYYYHMWKSGEKMVFVLCPKTDDFNNWCALCAVTSKLYTGTDTDKKLASDVKRKERHVANFYIVDDPRDKEIDDDEKKHSGKVKIYEFPGKLESKVKQEVTDKKEGLGAAIFDPSAEGYNLIIKIATTKADKNNKTYPDYSNSTFSRRSSSLGTDKEIDAIMKSRYSLKEYLDGMKTEDEALQTLLKNERLWEMIQDEWARNKGGSSVKTNGAKTSTPNLDKKEEDVPDFSDTDTSDADLLAELDKI
jgi:hypothetical protein